MRDERFETRAVADARRVGADTLAGTSAETSGGGGEVAVPAPTARMMAGGAEGGGDDEAGDALSLRAPLERLGATATVVGAGPRDGGGFSTTTISSGGGVGVRRRAAGGLM